MLVAGYCRGSFRVRAVRNVDRRTIEHRNPPLAASLFFRCSPSNRLIESFDDRPYGACHDNRAAGVSLEGKFIETDLGVELTV